MKHSTLAMSVHAADLRRPGVAAAIVTESEDCGEFQDDVGIG